MDSHSSRPAQRRRGILPWYRGHMGAVRAIQDRGYREVDTTVRLQAIDGFDRADRRLSLDHHEDLARRASGVVVIGLGLLYSPRLPR
jgi:hypothetical protein